MQSVFGQWLASLDSALEAESEAARLYQHNATAGTVREFLVKDLLRRFLPALVTIESGKVIDASGGMSNQIDVILFDSRVPCLRSPDGVGLFPVEGVLGTISVKTRISSTPDVVEALENCHSVIARTATGDADFQAAVDRKVNEVMRQERLSRLDAYVLVMQLAFPATYVFAIEDGITAPTLCDAIDTWFHRQKDFVELLPGIPRMIVAGHTIAVAHDRISKISVTNDVLKAAHEVRWTPLSRPKINAS